MAAPGPRRRRGPRGARGQPLARWHADAGGYFGLRRCERSRAAGRAGGAGGSASAGGLAGVALRCCHRFGPAPGGAGAHVERGGSGDPGWRPRSHPRNQQSRPPGGPRLQTSPRPARRGPSLGQAAAPQPGQPGGRSGARPGAGQDHGVHPPRPHAPCRPLPRPPPRFPNC